MMYGAMSRTALYAKVLHVERCEQRVYRQLYYKGQTPVDLLREWALEQAEPAVAHD